MCLLASAFGFACMACCVRLTDDYGGAISSFQKSLFRNVIAFSIAAAVFLRQPHVGALSRRGWGALLLRCSAGTVGIFCNFFALGIIPINEAMTLNKTAPFWTVLFAWLFLGEKANAKKLGGLVLAFVGALCVMKPGFQGATAWASACALLGGLGAGLAYACVRELGKEQVNSAFIVLFFSGFSTLACLPFLAGGFAPMTFAQVVILLGAGIGAALGQFGITLAYRFAPPKEIAVYDYSNVIFTALLGYFFLAQTPDILSAVGFLLIVLAALRAR